ncbi:MAG: hypothetical protein JKY56_00790 [Kofleriaceae bacterium]|nr:hypothetical protein [Kofleriaceae bacterium]
MANAHSTSLYDVSSPTDSGPSSSIVSHAEYNVIPDETNFNAMRPIQNEADHQIAMKRIDELWDCGPGSPEADELEVLGILVDAFEVLVRPYELAI